MKSRVRYLLVTQVRLLALGSLFWVTCCSNREHEWYWWKTRMGLDLYPRTFWNVWNFLLQILKLFSIGRIVFNAHGPPWFLRCSFDTTWFQVFNRETEGVSFSGLYVVCMLNLWSCSALSWTVWKGIDHSSDQLTDSVSKKSCVLPVPHKSSWSLSCSSWLELRFTVSRCSYHRLLVN